MKYDGKRGSSTKQILDVFRLTFFAPLSILTSFLSGKVASYLSSHSLTRRLQISGIKSNQKSRQATLAEDISTLINYYPNGFVQKLEFYMNLMCMVELCARFLPFIEHV